MKGMYMGKSKTPRELTREREKIAWRMRQRLATQQEIATELGITQGAVHKILRRTEDRAIRRLDSDVLRAKARQVLQLENIISQAYQGWEASRNPTETVKEAASGETERTTTTNSGNPGHLRVAMDGLKQIREIYRMDELPTPPQSPLEGWDGKVTDLFKEYE